MHLYISGSTPESGGVVFSLSMLYQSSGYMTGSATLIMRDILDDQDLVVDSYLVIFLTTHMYCCVIV